MLTGLHILWIIALFSSKGIVCLSLHFLTRSWNMAEEASFRNAIFPEARHRTGCTAYLTMYRGAFHLLADHYDTALSKIFRREL